LNLLPHAYFWQLRAAQNNDRSHLENLRVSLLDRVGLREDAFWILLHQVDIGELADARLPRSGVREYWRA
jgi:hypothetical protein